MVHGAGTIRRRGNIFGYIGRSSFGSTDLAKALDISAMYDLNKHINLNFYYGYAWGGGVVENIYTKDADADTTYFELSLKF